MARAVGLLYFQKGRKQSLVLREISLAFLSKNTEIKMIDIGEHMQEYARSIQRKSGVEKSLISSMKGKGIVLLTVYRNVYRNVIGVYKY